MIGDGESMGGRGRPDGVRLDQLQRPIQAPPIWGWQAADRLNVSQPVRLKPARRLPIKPFRFDGLRGYPRTS